MTELIVRSPMGAEVQLCAVDNVCPDIVRRPLDLSKEDLATIRRHKCVNEPPTKPDLFSVQVIIYYKDNVTIQSMGANGSGS